jgi:hypothetical protein
MRKIGKKTKSTSNKTENTKVKNATPTTYDGIDFRSKLEVYCYKKLKQNNIKAGYESHTFTILEAFKYLDESIRKMTYTPDFVGENFIIECKGNMNESFPLRWKIFKYFLFKNKLTYKLYLPRNQKEVDIVIENILNVDNE